VRQVRQLVQDLRSGKLDVVDVPDPSPSAREVIVRTHASLISAGTELALVRAASAGWIGKARERPDAVRKVVEKAREDGLSAAVSSVRARLDDLVMHGYSSAGIVEEVGPGVATRRVGDRVACVGANVAYHAERVAVPEGLCVPLPGTLDFGAGAFGAVGAIAAHGVRLAEIEAGSVVVVVGLGLIGQIATQLATAAGARVVGVDPVLDKVALATRLGAVGADADAASVRELVESLGDGNGADAILVTAATREAGALDAAAELARDRATVCVVGDVPLVASRRLYYEKELQLRVSRSYGPGRYDPEYEEEGRDYPIPYVRWTERRLVRFVLEEAAAGRLRVEELITHEFPIERAAEAYAALSEPGRLAVLLRYAADPRPSERTVQLRAAAGSSGATRAGLIGPGAFARATLLPLLAREKVDVRAVVGTTPARAAGVGRRWGATYASSTADELLADTSIDVVVIATRHDSHAALAAEALAAGKAVFLEKPLAIAPAELAELLPLLQDGGRLFVDFNRGFAPATRAVAAHFAGRREPVSIHCRVNAGFVDPGSWVRDPEVGGGRLVGEGCHFVDLCGTLAASGLETVTTVPLGRGPRTLDGDNFSLTLRYADGSVATIAYVANGSPAMSKERVEVIGSGRSAVIDDFRRVELDGRRRSGRSRRDKGHADAVAAAFRFFREGGEPPVPYERMLETTRATFVARGALAAGDTAPRPVHGG
jgi:predicted dehydrogenase/threonine dehydrogenase-like Zn-dependent dehydrogenase